MNTNENFELMDIMFDLLNSNDLRLLPLPETANKIIEFLNKKGHAAKLEKAGNRSCVISVNGEEFTLERPNDKLSRGDTTNRFYAIAGDIELFVRRYSIYKSTLPRVLNDLIRYLKDYGYIVRVIDDKRRDYKIIQVEEYRYKIVRCVDCCSFSVESAN